MLSKSGSPQLKVKNNKIPSQPKKTKPKLAISGSCSQVRISFGHLFITYSTGCIHGCDDTTVTITTDQRGHDQQRSQHHSHEDGAYCAARLSLVASWRFCPGGREHPVPLGHTQNICLLIQVLGAGLSCPHAQCPLLPLSASASQPVSRSPASSASSLQTSHPQEIKQPHRNDTHHLPPPFSLESMECYLFSGPQIPPRTTTQVG